MSLDILIIDDDPSFRKILERRLKALFPQSVATSFDRVAKARDFLYENRAQETQARVFDLVILDHHLPDGSGMDLLHEGWFEQLAVVIMSSDNAPEIPGESLRAGASYFIGKDMLSEPLFQPLLEGLVERNKLQRKMIENELQVARLDTVKTLVSTLRHEINNPLGAVLGAAYFLQNATLGEDEHVKVANLVEASGKRIKHVLDELCQAMSLEPVKKANQKLFQVPGDKPWEE